MNVATGLATGGTASAALVEQAIERALAAAGVSIPNSVLLFLSQEFAADPVPALKAAMRASSCMQIIGCSAAGIFTEQEWVLDAPAAAAMVFGGDVSLQPVSEPQASQRLLTLAAPNAINSSWIEAPGQRFGAISGDATGRGPFKVWCGGKLASAGRCEVEVSGASAHIGVSQGVRAISPPLEITQVSGFDLISLRQQPALNVLARELPLEVREMERIPLHLLMAGITIGDPATAISEGRFRLAPIISTNSDDRSVTLSQRLSPGERLFWALRQPLAAERDMRHTVDLLNRDAAQPRFAMLFPCMGRGPYFYGGVDRDLDIVTARYPGMPVIGFYGNGEIAPFNGGNQLFQYAAVLSLFY